MSNIKNYTPYFECNGKRYEIRRNRYLQAEFDKMKGEITLTEDEQIGLAKEQDLNNRLEKLADRKNELYDKYLETFSAEDEELYNKACSAYDLLIETMGRMDSIISKQRKILLDIGEKIIIKSLQMDENGNTIRTEEEATDIWCSFVDENGGVLASEFVAFTTNYIVGGDDETENSFISQAKAKAEQKANMRKGMKKVN